ncbi:hypothetical protein SAE02_33040 [Skermanella aerolata]|uniref:Uncharacterized protein n=1 Tax=Skermanella aerolata TaxID=393310 RepID=A0A512DRV4_9PROT|nr:hypothetical protein SAE02_33040 [Skermanella aerolata]
MNEHSRAEVLAKACHRQVPTIGPRALSPPAWAIFRKLSDGGLMDLTWTRRMFPGMRRPLPNAEGLPYRLNGNLLLATRRAPARIPVQWRITMSALAQTHDRRYTI